MSPTAQEFKEKTKIDPDWFLRKVLEVLGLAEDEPFSKSSLGSTTYIRDKSLKIIGKIHYFADEIIVRPYEVDDCNSTSTPKRNPIAKSVPRLHKE